MTKKDFQLIASTISGLNAYYPHGKTVTDTQRLYIAEAFADALAGTNPLFKRELFIQAATQSVTIARKAKEFWLCITCSDETVANAIPSRSLASDLAEDR